MSNDAKMKAELDKAKASPFARHLEVAPIRESYRGTGKLQDKTAIITGGDSGIGRAVAVHYAREGADVVIVYNLQDEEAQETKSLVETEGRRCLVLKGDIADPLFCKSIVESTKREFGRLDILVNNAGRHEEDKKLEDISREQLMRTFDVNVFAVFYITQAALAVMEEHAVIINTASIVAFRGSGHLMDYAATKGAVMAFTRSLAQNLAEKKIRVNAVAPGPVWTPLVISTFPEAELAKFGKDTPLGRAGYPQEVAPAFVYLASDDSTYVTGQTIHVNGGEIVNG